MTTVEELAAAIDGTVRDNTLIIITRADNVLVVDCAHTGKVWLNTHDGRFQLGSIGDGVEHLASMYYACTSEVCS